MIPKIKIITCFVLLLFISCSSPTDSDWGEFALSTRVIDEKIIITNNTNRTLYLFIVERGIIGDWVPHFDEPKVQWDDSNKSRSEGGYKIIFL